MISSFSKPFEVTLSFNIWPYSVPSPACFGVDSGTEMGDGVLVVIPALSSCLRSCGLSFVILPKAGRGKADGSGED
jgi:hypothetical protein